MNNIPDEVLIMENKPHTEVSIKEAQTGIIRECPYCHSHKIESMGFRAGSESRIRRYRCLNPECMKSHSRNADDNAVLGFGVPEPVESKPKRFAATLNVSNDTKIRFISYKMCEGELQDELLNRILTELDFLRRLPVKEQKDIMAEV
jgi:hypothetical protein